MTPTNLNDVITELTAEIQTNTSVELRALALIQSIPTLISAAVAAAQAAGATPDQLTAFGNLITTLQQNDQNLANAVTQEQPGSAGTPGVSKTGHAIAGYQPPK